MAEKTRLEDVLKPSVTEVNIEDKYLHVPTLSDGYTGTVHGTYVYQVKKEGNDYKVAEVLYDEEKDKTYLSDEFIIMTDGDIIFFMTRTTSDPYNFPAVSEEKLKDSDVKEKQVLQAFIAFAEDEFKLGVYNVFLADDPYIYGEEDNGGDNGNAEDNGNDDNEESN